MITMTGKYTNAKVMIDEVEESCVAQITKFINNPAFTAPVAIMPDCHAGKGSVVGFTMPMTDKVIPNTIGVDIGCFTEDTKVALADNRSLSFAELIQEESNGIEHFGFSKDKNDNIVISKLENVRKTRTVNDLIEITLDNDMKYKCTTDHIHYLLDGKEVLAKDLTVEDALFPLYIECKNETHNKMLSYSNKKNKLNGYNIVYNPNTKKYDYIHFLADDYNRKNKIYANKGIRHHKDFNKLNNNPTNIQILEWAEHWKIHSSHVSESNALEKTGWKVSWKKHKKEWSKMSSQKMTALNKNPKFCKIRNTAATKTLETYMKSKEFYLMTRDAGKRGKKYLIEYNKSEAGRKMSGNIGRKVQSTRWQCNICKEVVIGPMRKVSHLKICKNDDVKNFTKLINHKIKNITFLKVNNVSVYCLSVKEYQNFALSSGIFIHNCGMLALKIYGNSQDIYDNLATIDVNIRKHVPFGQTIHKKSIINFEREFPFSEARRTATHFAQKLFGNNAIKNFPVYDMEWFETKCKQIGVNVRYACDSIGSLGGGNHFIEIGVDLNNDIWITIHSGSRNFGLRIANYWTEVAQSIDTTTLDLQMKVAVDAIKANATTPELRQRINQDIKLARLKIYDREDKISDELAYLTEENAIGYLFDMIFAQAYAVWNRKQMQLLILQKTLPSTFSVVESIESIHNYIDFNDMVIRKGAISAHSGEVMIIPFNMRDGILICKGKGNAEWNQSAPHGAGRVLARGAAKRTLSLDTFKHQMEGIYSTSVATATLDEAPDAYKSSKMIEEAIEPTAEIINRIKPLMNMKSFN
jgi:tRNA-splicing ligase RtcB (3'-phosphate/5'-hydroxy nucleic acid ligase)